MKTSIILLLVTFMISCSDAPEQEIKAAEVKTKAKTDHVLKGYQDQLQKAKDMEKEVLKAAERQKKAIDDASN
jgi:lipopolysaccharide export LptBFGC system permease protein LptF